MNALNGILEEFKEYISPLREAVKNKQSLEAFFNWMGWDIKTALGSGQFDTLYTSVGGIINTLDSLDLDNITDFEKFTSAIKDLSKVINGIKKLSSISGQNIPSDINELPKDLFDRLTVIYIQNSSRTLYDVLVFLQIIQNRYIKPDEVSSANDIKIRIKNVAPVINFDKLRSFLQNPKSHIENIYWPEKFSTDENTADSARLFFMRLAPVLADFGIFTRQSNERIAPFSAANNERLTSMLMLMKYFDSVDTNGVLSRVRLALILGFLSKESDGHAGLYGVLDGAVSMDKTIGDWLLSMEANASASGFELSDSGVSFFSDPTKNSIRIALKLTRDNQGTDPVFLIGSEDGTRFEVGNYLIKAFLEADQARQDAGIEMEMRDAKLVIGPSDGDGFIASILPDDGITIDFNLGIGYSKTRGLYFTGSGSLITQIPVYKEFLGITFETIDLAITLSEGDIKVYAATSFSLDLGFFKATLKRIGIRSDISFPNEGGNLGSLNLDLGFKSPSGLGLYLEGAFVSGGGLIDYDEASGRYSGMIELRFVNKITLKALAILDTKFPNGQDGYSLVIIISAGDFTPIQLGLGFTLNAVGGLLGLNRTMDVNALREGVRTNAIEDIFLPGDVLQNAPRIINNVGKFFPAQKGRFVAGPIGRIGWGTPSLITLDVGLIIELPSPVKIAMPGVLKAILPDANAAQLKLQVNFLGVLDLGKKYLSLDASLYDSRIITFTLTGDMALRLLWGDNSFFLLSVGGFHPAYSPPPLNLPQLRRLTVQVSNSSSLKLYFESYFAVTSNSVQFGAHIFAFAEAFGAKAEGYAGFDVLFLFSPFRFIANLGISVSISFEGFDILGAYLSLKLSGPRPWKAEGSVKASIDLGLFSISTPRIPFDVEFGNGSQGDQKTIAIEQTIKDAIASKDNWTILLPEKNADLITLKLSSDKLSKWFIHPNGIAKFSQRTIPLNIAIAKFGHASTSDIDKLEFKDFELGTTTVQPPRVNEQFPADQFLLLSEQQKLDAAQSFQNFQAGFQIGDSGLPLQAAYFNRKSIEYEHAIITARTKSFKAVSLALTDAQFKYHLHNNAITESPLSPSYKNQRLGDIAKVVAQEYKYFVANVNDHSNAGNGAYFDSSHEAKVYQQSLETSQPALRGKIMVMNTIET